MYSCVSGSVYLVSQKCAMTCSLYFTTVCIKTHMMQIRLSYACWLVHARSHLRVWNTHLEQSFAISCFLPVVWHHFRDISATSAVTWANWIWKTLNAVHTPVTMLLTTLEFDALAHPQQPRNLLPPRIFFVMSHNRNNRRSKQKKGGTRTQFTEKH